MSRVTHRQNAFNAGEISPRLKGRSDLDKFQFGLQQCHNAIVLPQGGVSRRPGFQHIYEAGQHNMPVMLIPFEFSADQSYVLELGHQYMRVFTDGGIVSTPDANTLLLLHFDGDDGSTVMLDRGPIGHVITPYGTAQLDNAQFKFDKTSLFLNGGLNDYITAPDHAGWAFGAGAFTADLQVRFFSLTGIHTLYFQGDATAGDFVWWYIDHEQGTINFRVVDGGVLLGHARFAWAPVADTWYHLALVRVVATNTLAMYVNGAALGAAVAFAAVMPDHSWDLRLGNTGLAMPVLYDFSDGAHVLTPVGTATRSITAAKWGDASIYFDGNSDYYHTPDHADWDIFTQTNVTIDLWVKHTDHAGTEEYVNHFQGAGDHWGVWHTHGTGLRMRCTGGGPDFSGGEITDSDWHHIAYVKVGTDHGLYLDGVQTAYQSNAVVPNFAGQLRLGAMSAGYYDGYMDDVRITHANSFGAAPNVGLTDTITVPTGPHLSDADTVLLVRADMHGLDGWIDEYRVSDVARWAAAFTPPIEEYPGAGGGVVYEETTTFDYPNYMDCRFVQSKDVLYLFHDMTEVHTITRNYHDDWDIDEVQWDEPPWQPVNETATTITPSAVTGNITLTASAPLFSPRHVGAYYYLNDGFCKVTAFTTNVLVSANVRSDFSGILATAIWHKGCWDLVDGYPITGTFHEDRLACLGNRGNPLTMFLSETSNYENFGAVGAADTDPMQINIWSEKQNALQWVTSGKRLFLGGTGAEFWMTGETLDMPITPTSILTRRESNIGGAGITPVMIGGDVIFAQRMGEKLRSWNYDSDTDAFMASDMSILAEHLTVNDPITRLEYAPNPYGIIWCSIESNGGLVGLTYLKDHKVIAFHEHTIADGGGGSAQVESMAVIPGDYHDELWVAVKRNIVGPGTVRYIERMSPHFFNDTLDYATMTDSYLSYTGAPTTTFVGMDHLEGETVQVLADGVYVGDHTIVAGGFTLAVAASVVVAGLEYPMALVTVLPDLQSETGSTGNKLKRIVEVCFDVYESGNFQFGRDWTNLLDAGVPSGTLTDATLLREFNGDHVINPFVVIRHDEPTPFTLLALTQEIELEDD